MIVHILPKNGDQNEHGRDLEISGHKEAETVKQAKDYAEQRGVGAATYSVRATVLAPVTARYDSHGSAGTGYALSRRA